jgi:hypothetical protein
MITSLDRCFRRVLGQNGSPNTIDLSTDATDSKGDLQTVSRNPVGVSTQTSSSQSATFLQNSNGNTDVSLRGQYTGVSNSQYNVSTSTPSAASHNSGSSVYQNGDQNSASSANAVTQNRETPLDNSVSSEPTTSRLNSQTTTVFTNVKSSIPSQWITASSDQPTSSQFNNYPITVPTQTSDGRQSTFRTVVGESTSGFKPASFSTPVQISSARSSDSLSVSQNDGLQSLPNSNAPSTGSTIRQTDLLSVPGISDGLASTQLSQFFLQSTTSQKRSNGSSSVSLPSQSTETSNGQTRISMSTVSKDSRLSDFFSFQTNLAASTVQESSQADQSFYSSNGMLDSSSGSQSNQTFSLNSDTAISARSQTEVYPTASRFSNKSTILSSGSNGEINRESPTPSYENDRSSVHLYNTEELKTITVTQNDQSATSQSNTYTAAWLPTQQIPGLSNNSSSLPDNVSLFTGSRNTNTISAFNQNSLSFNSKTDNAESTVSSYGLDNRRSSPNGGSNLDSTTTSFIINGGNTSSSNNLLWATTSSDIVPGSTSSNNNQGLFSQPLSYTGVPQSTKQTNIDWSFADVSDKRMTSSSASGHSSSSTRFLNDQTPFTVSSPFNNGQFSRDALSQSFTTAIERENSINPDVTSLRQPVSFPTTTARSPLPSSTDSDQLPSYNGPLFTTPDMSQPTYSSETDYGRKTTATRQNYSIWSIFPSFSPTNEQPNFTTKNTPLSAYISNAEEHSSRGYESDVSTGRSSPVSYFNSGSDSVSTSILVTFLANLSVHSSQSYSEVSHNASSTASSGHQTPGLFSSASIGLASSSKTDYSGTYSSNSIWLSASQSDLLNSTVSRLGILSTDTGTEHSSSLSSQSAESTLETNSPFSIDPNQNAKSTEYSHLQDTDSTTLQSNVSTVFLSNQNSHSPTASNAATSFAVRTTAFPTYQTSGRPLAGSSTQLTSRLSNYFSEFELPTVTSSTKSPDTEGLTQQSSEISGGVPQRSTTGNGRLTSLFQLTLSSNSSNGASTFAAVTSTLEQEAKQELRWSTLCLFNQMYFNSRLDSWVLIKHAFYLTKKN